MCMSVCPTICVRSNQNPAVAFLKAIIELRENVVKRKIRPPQQLLLAPTQTPLNQYYLDMG